jgi:chemotaxis protein methyltransferase CheR
LISSKSLVAFLSRHAARLGLRPQGYPRVARQVGRRLWARLAALGLKDLGSYEEYLRTHPEEWHQLDEMCRITISRLYRDSGVFDILSERILPDLAQQVQILTLWSAGCASGEEPATLALVWSVRLAARFPGVTCRILATDLGSEVLERAREARYGESSLSELPADLRAALVPDPPFHRLPDRLRQMITVTRHDVREPAPTRDVDVILCRNLAFTYFSPSLQLSVLAHFDAVLRPGGVLVTGAKERLPDQELFTPRAPGIYDRAGGTKE